MSDSGAIIFKVLYVSSAFAFFFLTNLAAPSPRHIKQLKNRYHCDIMAYSILLERLYIYYEVSQGVLIVFHPIHPTLHNSKRSVDEE